ncbi:hypothetical protein [Clostridium sp.]|uniref:hypothetical protein n=1 Tax=Clostridium sp. TaxID=1506 RepID=UPI003FD8FBE0
MVDKPTEFTLALRIPNWSKDTKIKVNDEYIKLDEICENGYVKITRVFHMDVICITFDLSIKSVISNPKVKSNAGKMQLCECLKEFQPLFHLIFMI